MPDEDDREEPEEIDLFEVIRAEGELVAFQKWDSGGPGGGAGEVELYSYEGLFYVFHDAGMEEYEEPWRGIEANGIDRETSATVRIWISPDLLAKRLPNL